MATPEKIMRVEDFSPENASQAMLSLVPEKIGTQIESNEIDPLHKEEGFLNESDIALLGLAKLGSKYIDHLKAESTVVEFERIETEKTSDGSLIRTYGLQSSQGYNYAVQVGVPRHQTTNVTLISTTALGTSIRGHNEHTMRKVMENGMPVISMGAEYSHRPTTQWHDEPSSEVSLANPAATLLNLSRRLGELLPDYIHSTDRVVAGDSRGAMVAMGVLALDKTFEQNVLLADLHAPCFPRKMRPSDLGGLARQWVKEPGELVALGARLFGKRLLHYPATVDLGKKAMEGHIKTFRAIVSGEAGEMAKSIETSKIAHITTFKNDFASMHSEWESIFSEHPNVRITPLPGGHLTLASSETLAYFLGRNQAFIENYNKNGADNLSPDEIFDTAHWYAEQFIHYVD